MDAVGRNVGRLAQLGISTVLIGNGDPHFIGGFVERQRLDGYPLELYTDPTRRVFELAGLDRSAWRTLGPTALLHELRARAKGYFSTAKEGDVFQQGGALLVDRHGAVVFAEAAEYAAKPVDTARVVEAALLLAAESAEAVEVA